MNHFLTWYRNIFTLSSKLALMLALAFAALVIGNDIYVAIKHPFISPSRAIIGAILLTLLSLLVLAPVILLFCRIFAKLRITFGLWRALIALLFSLGVGLSTSPDAWGSMIFPAISSFWIVSLVTIFIIMWLIKPKSSPN